MHMTGIEIKCTKEQKEALIELLSEGLSLGKIIPKDKVEIGIETQIKWDVIKIEKCKWTYVDGEYYDTECSNTFTTPEGDREDNGIKYCPFCGKEIIED